MGVFSVKNIQIFEAIPAADFEGQGTPATYDVSFNLDGLDGDNVVVVKISVDQKASNKIDEIMIIARNKLKAVLLDAIDKLQP